MNRNYLIGLSCISLALAGCTDEPKKEPLDEPIDKENELVKVELSRSEEAVAQATHDFAFNLLRETTAMASGENVLVSPFSMSSAWAMIANGAKGETQKVIIEALGFNGMDMADVNSYYSKMYTALPSLDSASEMCVSNGFFYNALLRINNEFSSVLQNEYSAEVNGIEVWTDFPKTVNEWISQKTNGKVVELMDENVPAVYNWIAANAMYFNGKWSTGCKFQTQDTKNGIFHNNDGAESTVPFMYQHQDAWLAYYDEESVMIELPFGNEAYSLRLILPDEGTSVTDYIATLDVQKWTSLLQQKKAVNLKIRVPKFDIAPKFDMYGVLRKCGFEKAMTWSADYSALSDGKSEGVNYVMQGCSMKIDEEGAEASASSVVGDFVTAPIASDNLELTFDRPFMYVLMENTTQTILMTGVITIL